MDEQDYVDEEMEPNPDLNRITNAIIGAAIAVHRVLGPGHLELIYSRALEIEFKHRGIPFEREFPITLSYRGQVVGTGRLDFLVEGKVIVDLKSIEAIGPVQRAQSVDVPSHYRPKTRHHPQLQRCEACRRDQKNRQLILFLLGASVSLCALC
jgi:GxxExxY protein